jgi:protein SCO1/2
MMKQIIYGGLIGLCCLMIIPADAQVVQKDAPELKKINVVEHLGDTIPMDLAFTNSKGESIMLSDLFQPGKPVLLTLAYYECPMLCTFVLNGLSKGLSDLNFIPGTDFQMITISIDPKETWNLAATKQKNQQAAVGKPFPEDGWQFLVGTQENIKRLADAVGFVYYYDQARDEYAHPAVSFVLSDKGMITRYLYGIEFKENDLHLALLEASEGKIGDTLDKIVLYCYHYDPDAGGYVLFAGNVMRLGGVITMLFLGGALGLFWHRERRKRHAVTDGQNQ